MPTSVAGSNTAQSGEVLAPRTARGRRTLARLLRAAETEFGEKGFHAASVSGMTQRAKIAQGTFYLYFGSKEACFSALLQSIGDRLRRRMAMAVRRGGERMDTERRGLEAFLRFAFQHPDLYRIVQESQFVDPHAHRAYYERIAQGYSAALNTAADRGDLSPGDAETRAWAIMGIGHFLGLRYCLWRKSLPPPEALDEAMRFIADGMVPKP